MIDRSATVGSGADRRPHAWVTAGLACVLLAAYLLLDLREGGRASSLLTTRLSTPSFYISHFGGWYFWGSFVLDAVLAVATAAVVAGSVVRYRWGRTAAGGVCTGAATLLFGFAVFGCPGCIVPLFGTLGVALFANALPLFGLEFKVAAIAVTLAALAWLRRQSQRAPDRLPMGARGPRSAVPAG